MSPVKTFYKVDLSEIENNDKFSKEWLPKVLKYRETLKNNTVQEYKIDASKIPENLDAQFNAVNFLYEEKLLTENEFNITDQTASSLVDKLQTGKLTAVETLRAFSRRAIIAQQFTNFAVDIFIEDGLKRARELDDYYAKYGKTVGPLHGLPISLKAQFNFQGRVTHGGYVSHIENIPSSNNVSVQILRNLGAVFYVRTNVPQTMMHLDSDNNLVGRTRNPYNLALSSGGSSSGEGALVGFGGSPLGIGTDIGGSIRAPASFSGCIGFRPTSRRISNHGSVSAGSGQESIPSVCGPLARSVEDIELFMKHYINEGHPWNYDPWALRIPWKDIPVPSTKDITIAIMWDDEIVRPSPPIERGLKYVVEKFRKAGIRCIDFKPIKTKLAYETTNATYTCDGNFMQAQFLAESGEPLKELTKWFLNFNEGKELNVTDNRSLNNTRDLLRLEYNTWMVENNVDFILTATYNNVAPKPNKAYNWSYTSLFNLLDFPSLAFQTGLFQDPKIDKLLSDFQPRNTLEELEYKYYNSEDFTGAPIGLQVAGRRYFDEEVVAACKLLVLLL